MKSSKKEVLLYRGVDNFLRKLFRLLPINRTTEYLALFWGYRFRPEPQIVRLRNGQSIYVDPSDYLQCLIYYFGIFEPHCIDLVKKLLGSGDYFVDIGGNIGLYSIYGSQLVGPVGKVMTFEPIPHHVARIHENISLNNISNVVVYETALGDAPGMVDLSIPEGGNQGCFSIVNHLENAEMFSHNFQVKISRFDDIIKHSELSKIKLIKMDIEGAEFKALNGMEELFNNNRPSVIIELNQEALNRQGCDCRSVIEWFADRGYRGWIILNNGELIKLSRQDISFCECLFIHECNELDLKLISE